MATSDTNNAKSAHVLPETRAIAVLGCFDLLATVFLLGTRRAMEANPLATVMLAHFGPAGFALFKAMALAVPLTIAELARRKRPIFVQKALRIGLYAYLVLLLFAYRQQLLALIDGGR